ncbi:DUF6053 domain-containing protein [Lysobacter sp. CA199]
MWEGLQPPTLLAQIIAIGSKSVGPEGPPTKGFAACA